MEEIILIVSTLLITFFFVSFITIIFFTVIHQSNVVINMKKTYILLCLKKNEKLHIKKTLPCFLTILLFL